MRDFGLKKRFSMVIEPKRPQRLDINDHISDDMKKRSSHLP